MDDDDLTQSWEGRGQHLHDALDDAWNNAKKNGAGPGRYVVQYVAIEAENPIRTYIVIIGPGE